jgi:GAF domain-containing protein
VVELAQAPLRMDQAHERWSVLAWNIALGTGGILCLILLPAAWRSHRRTMAEATSTSQRSVQRTQELQRTTEQLRDALKSVKQRAEETDRMLEVTEAIGSAIEQKALFEVIAHGAARACRVDRGSIFLRDKTGQLMVPVSSQLADRTGGAARGADGAETLRALALEEMPSFLLEAVRRQEPVVISDPGSDPRVPQGWVGLFQAKSALVVPLIHQGRTAGVLILDHLKTLHVFTDEEIRLATTLAAQAAVALEKARLYDEIQQRLQQTETLLAVSQAIGSAPDLPEAIRRTTREMVRILGADTGVAWCVTGGGDRFIPLAGYHVPRDLREPLSGLPGRERDRGDQHAIAVMDAVALALRQALVRGFVKGPVTDPDSADTIDEDSVEGRLSLRVSVIAQILQAALIESGPTLEVLAQQPLTLVDHGFRDRRRLRTDANGVRW